MGYQSAQEFSFEVVRTCPETGARAGILRTPHSVIETPVFMPVGTQGTVKTLSQQELEEFDARIILGNTYHLYLRPGSKLVREAGGLHGFMGWPRSILTDSGGFQVFSLSDLRKLTENGVEFRSHIDGSLHLFTPESVIEIQDDLGSDIVMPLDECIPYPVDIGYAEKSCRRTLLWADRAREAHERTGTGKSVLFGICQGSVFPELRERVAERMASMDFWGYSIGGLAVGEPKNEMFDIVKLSTDVLPEGKPRYLMGVGFPDDIVEAVSRGVDMFDCVMPTRNARNGTVFTSDGKLVLRNAHEAENFGPIDADCSCPACRHYTRAYIRHLFRAGEILAPRLATMHSIFFYLETMRNMRRAILDDRFPAWRGEFLSRFRGKGKES
ncbi:MAG: tRNA guanosine(34) transglycosylase Tgt [Candidatus Latescibacteria bacterium]|nr:tRNA guanosine(34) transglycosylase Tgt [Candidatus Latescibacterota bacterium]